MGNKINNNLFNNQQIPSHNKNPLEINKQFNKIQIFKNYWMKKIISKKLSNSLIKSLIHNNKNKSKKSKKKSKNRQIKNFQ